MQIEYCCKRMENYVKNKFNAITEQIRDMTLTGRCSWCGAKLGN